MYRVPGGVNDPDPIKISPGRPPLALYPPPNAPLLVIINGVLEPYKVKLVGSRSARSFAVVKPRAVTM